MESRSAFFRLSAVFLFSLAAAAPVLVPAPAARAQGVQILEPVETQDRQVILRWTQSTADTLTQAERVTVPIGLFLVDVDLGINTTFPNASLVRGRGAGAKDQNEYVIRVGNSEDMFREGQEDVPSEPATFQVTGAFQFGKNYIGVGFSNRVNQTQALNAANYGITPGSVTVSAVSLQDNGKTVILDTGSSLPGGTAVTVTVGGISNENGDPLTNPGGFSLQTVSGSVLNIADVRDNRAGLKGQTVTVVGQVTIPVGSRLPGIASGYIQDGSRRGINLYGDPVVAAVNARSNVVEVSGTVVDTLGSLSLRNYSASVVKSGQPFLGARKLSLEDASGPGWEGTYIEAGGSLARIDKISDSQVTLIEVTRLDTLFTGYRIWRSPSEGKKNFSLLRSYSLLDTTWTFTGDLRIFADPDSIIPGGVSRDPDFDPDEPLPGPFNGFGYLYAVTTFNAVIDATVFPFRLRFFENEDPEDVARPEAVFPGREARVTVPLLGEVKVVPNPFNPSAAYDKQAFPGPARVQFVNLPASATIEIYTVAGDLVTTLEKEEDTNVDSVDWDLTNHDGDDVSPGIYMYRVVYREESKMGHFVIAR
jgi:hypothetical protein